MTEQFKDPINSIQWLQVANLKANDYNPNVVFSPEMKLLKLSLMTNGWIQPLLVSADGIIIDGFHRWFLSSNDKDVQARYNGLAPCAVLDLTPAERMLLTVRINRAKGSHIAVKMHDLITAVHKEHGYSVQEIAKQIGGTKDEVELLLKENVFKALDIENHKFSQAWVPK
jgi:ParB-like chromosome segregation protein Spo0J